MTLLKKTIFLLPLFISRLIFAQNLESDSTKQLIKNFPIKIEGVIDVYYAYDFGNPQSNERPDYLYHYKKHNEFSLNLGLIRVEVDNKKYHGAFGLMAGTFPEYNMRHEQDALKNVYEAYAGIKLGNELWLDAGIFSSHIGFESAIGPDNITLTRSITAENTPYYLSGAKLYYEGLNKWNFSFTICNGWQNIQETPNNSNKGIGLQVNYNLSDEVEFYYNNFYSNEAPDSAQQFMFYNQVFTKINISNKIKTIIAFDYGIKETSNRRSLNNWMNPTVILQYKITDPFHVGLRYEYYQDNGGAMIATGTKNNFDTHGTSINLDYWVSKSSVLRVEGRYFNSKDNIYTYSSNSISNTNFAVTTSMAITF